MIEITGLCKSYKIGKDIIKAVDNASFKVNKGDSIMIYGHSGSGKTTLLSIIGGLTKPELGTVRYGGTELWSLTDNDLSEFRNKRINFIFQFSSLIPTLTVLENIILPATFNKAARRGIIDDAQDLLSKVGLQDKQNAYPSQLSGGQQRRAAIARAFINNPEIILADEPTGDLDEETENEMLELCRKMNVEKGITFIIVTHNTDIAKQCNKHFVMNRGILTSKDMG
ncbi:MAG: ABC transporter ATP-binding protein [Nitrospirae bacterium]|nr:ABC transporter ATP-binding protein [Nitrospirota bacterium]